MPNPFPGAAPCLRQRWDDIGLAAPAEARRALNQALPADLVARVGHAWTPRLTCGRRLAIMNGSGQQIASIKFAGPVPVGKFDDDREGPLLGDPVGQVHVELFVTVRLGGKHMPLQAVPTAAWAAELLANRPR